MSGSCERCCSGAGKWIWLVLVVIVAAVLIAKNTAHKADKKISLNANSASPTVETNTAGMSGLNSSVQTRALPRLVDLGAGKCIPCKMMAPILEDLKKSYAGRLEVEVIDVWENPDAGRKYGIRVIPTQIFYDSQGRELFRHEGFLSKEAILAKWKELGISLQEDEH